MVSRSLVRERRAFRGRRHDLVREPDAGDLHIRFDERRLETEPWRGVRHRHSESRRQQLPPSAYRYRASCRLYSNDCHGPRRGHIRCSCLIRSFAIDSSSPHKGLRFVFHIICLIHNIATMPGLRKRRTGPAAPFSPAVSASLFDLPAGSKSTPASRASDRPRLGLPTVSNCLS